MRDRPSGAVLRRLAEGLSGEPAVRCRAIAEREERAGESAFAQSRAALVARYGAAEDGSLLARLADDIRIGSFDRPGPAQDWLFALLAAITRQKLAESNPAFLEGR